MQVVHDEAVLALQADFRVLHPHGLPLQGRANRLVLVRDGTGALQATWAFRQEDGRCLGAGMFVARAWRGHRLPGVLLAALAAELPAGTPIVAHASLLNRASLRALEHAGLQPISTTVSLRLPGGRLLRWDLPLPKRNRPRS